MKDESEYLEKLSNILVGTQISVALISSCLTFSQLYIIVTIRNTVQLRNKKNQSYTFLITENKNLCHILMTRMHLSPISCLNINALASTLILRFQRHAREKR